MFGDLPLATGADGRVEVVSRDPDADAERCCADSLPAPIADPVREEDVPRFLKLARRPDGPA
jgi:hypothetical protein